MHIICNVLGCGILMRQRGREVIFIKSVIWVILQNYIKLQDKALDILNNDHFAHVLISL